MQISTHNLNPVKHGMTEKQKYFRLLSHVCESLPTSAIDKLIATGYALGSTALMQVRIGRTINLAALVALVRVALPDFEIPAELLPAPQPVSLLS